MANLLQTVARLYNIQAKYRDGFGQIRAAPPDAILSVLGSLGAPVRAHDDLPDALRERRQAQWQRCIEPITVAWRDRPFKIKVRLPERLAQSQITAEVILENGTRLDARCEDVPGVKPVLKEIEGARYVDPLFTRASVAAARLSPFASAARRSPPGVTPHLSAASGVRPGMFRRQALGRFLPSLCTQLSAQLGCRRFQRSGGVRRLYQVS